MGEAKVHIGVGMAYVGMAGASESRFARKSQCVGAPDSPTPVGGQSRWVYRSLHRSSLGSG